MKDSVVNLKFADDAELFGGKASNLSKLLHLTLPVPNGFAISLEAFNKEGQLTEQSIEDILRLLDKGTDYAVRSSATSEDSEDASWAGQFETFLNTKSWEVIAKVEECHNSAKARAEAYAENQSGLGKFNVAVVVQEMLEPEYAGVLFTKDPLTGDDRYVCEYVKGLGEELVSGRADPHHLDWIEGDTPQAPFDVSRLSELAKQVKNSFDKPQDIEWVWAKGKMWLVQTRPITAIQEDSRGINIGEPEDLFYWGPSRAKPMYMSDFMYSTEKFFIDAYNDSEMPNPPNTLVLFYDNKIVWLNNAQAFVDFTEACFIKYLSQDRFVDDITKWQVEAKLLNNQSNVHDVAEAWRYTLFAEFSLYGAEPAINKLLERFDSKTRQEIWGAFTVPSKPTFLNALDKELFDSKDVEELAKKYPWIEDGYSGVNGTAHNYFDKRLRIVEESEPYFEDPSKKRKDVSIKHKLTNDELKALDLARNLAEFMDDRKKWMMETRSLIKDTASEIENGWFFGGGKTLLLDEQATEELWERYVDFKASSKALSGVVASNGGRHFVNGEVRVILGPTDNVEDDMILVVPATSPSYVPLMRKARALVTDHGGMMSHAAIVGREFNLPCIVGTKQATKVLKDGDRVVLDLVKGDVSL